MKMPQRIAATTLCSLALTLGFTTLQVPAASAADPDPIRLDFTETDRAEKNPRFESSALVSPGQAVRWTFPEWDATVTSNGNFAYLARERRVFMGVVSSPDRCVAYPVAAPVVGDWVEETIFRSVAGEGTTGQTVEWPRSYDVPANAGGQYLCAFQRVQVTIQSQGEVLRGSAVSQAVLGPQVQSIPRLQTLFPRAPWYSTNSGSNVLYPGADLQIVAELANNISNETVQGRWVTVSFPNFATPGTCRGQQGEVTTDIREFGTAAVRRPATIPDSAGGKYMCLQQSVITDAMDRVVSSEPVTFAISRGMDSVVPISAVVLDTSLARLIAATSRLGELQSQPSINQAALAAAAAEAEEARREAEAAAQAAQAQAQQQGQQQMGGAPAAAQIAQVQQAAQAATTAVEKAIGSATIDSATQTSLSALAIATGFDPFTTPVLQAGEKNASGVSIKVTTAPAVQQKKSLATKLTVQDPVTRGGMRQYFVDLNGATPKLLFKRSGFVPKGSKSKRFYIRPTFKPGTYGVLTTFQPSTPGMQGVAVFNTVEVKSASKKKGKGKRN
jgi:hypothetical protein